MIELIGEKLTQWDTGRYVQVNDDTIDEVHCCGEDDTETLNVKLEHKDGVIIAPIPNILLQKSQRIIVYTVEVSGDERRTVESKVLHVWERAKPDDYVYTETEVKSYEALEKRIEALEESGGVSDEQIAEAVDKYMSENPIDIPTKLPNPHALTINGTEYDGSKAVNLTIEGGDSDGDYVKSVNGTLPDENGNVVVDVGGEGEWRLLKNDTLTEDVTTLWIGSATPINEFLFLCPIRVNDSENSLGTATASCRVRPILNGTASSAEILGGPLFAIRKDGVRVGTLIHIKREKDVLIADGMRGYSSYYGFEDSVSTHSKGFWKTTESFNGVFIQLKTSTHLFKSGSALEVWVR